MINNPVPAGGASAPRGLVYANGELLHGVVQTQVDNNSFFQADTFKVVLALSAQPAGRGFNFWASLEKAEIEILMGTPANPEQFQRADLTSFILGNTDDIEIDLVADTITLAGRDLTSMLIDAKNTIAHVANAQTASDIVTLVAQQVGLTPVVTATKAPTGAYVQIVKSLIEQKASYWDIITKLAQIEQFQVYVKGRELHFEPRAAPSASPYVLRYTPKTFGGAFDLNATRLVFTRNLSIAKDLKVTVMSWNQKTNKVVTETAERARVFNKTTKSVARTDGAPQAYTYMIPNLTNIQAQQKAQAILHDLSSHEMNLSADMPGDVLLTPQSMIQVQGTDTPFDQAYFPSSVTRSLSYDDGFRMILTAKNQTPNTAT